MQVQTTPLSAAHVLIKNYVDMSIVNRLESPLDFWKCHKSALGGLYDLHLKYSSVPATSVPSERIFFKAGQIINDRRNKLCSKTLDSIIFLNSNIRCFEF